MRFWLVLALGLAVLTSSATAQKHQKPKAKPSYSEEKQAKSGARTAKAPVSHNTSAAQELHRVEQSTAKASASRRSAGNQAHMAPVLKAQKKDVNPPIHATGGSGGGHGSKSSKGGGDPNKGRLRHKGSHH